MVGYAGSPTRTVYRISSNRSPARLCQTPGLYSRPGLYLRPGFYSRKYGYVGVTLTRSKVKVNITGLLNFRQLAKPCMLAAMTAAPLRGFFILFFRSSPGDDVVDWTNSGVSVRPYVRTSTKSFSDFHLIWCVGRPRSDVRISVTSTRSKVKVKVTELPKLRKVHFSRSISSVVFAWRSKLMVDGHSMGPVLQLVGARFLNFLLGKLSREFKLRPVSIFHEIQMATFRSCVMLQLHGWAR